VGRGAHGTTWRARDPESGAVRAIKELPLRLGTPDKTVQLFRREAEVLQQLDHPGVPACHDAFETGAGRNRTLWIVQAFVEGQSLERELRTRRYDEDEVLGIVQELLRTLTYLHGRSPPVVHRDIKPANVIRQPDGSLVLVDFGSVRDALRDPDLGGSTVAGTFGYMAPEQFAGDAEPRTDLYGVGALAVALLTRKPPHTLQDVSGRLRWRPHAHVQPATRQLLDALLAPDVVDRLPSAQQALARVQAIRSGQVPSPAEPAAPSQATEPSGWPVQEHEGPSALAVVGPRARGGRVRLSGAGSRPMTQADHGRAIAVIERDLGVSGHTEILGETVRWRSDPASGRMVQLSLERATDGTSIVVQEDLRGLWGGLLGGLGGGLGGGLAGGLGWMFFVNGDVTGGLVFIGVTVLGALLMAVFIARWVQRRRVEQLSELISDLQRGFGGAAGEGPRTPRLGSTTPAALGLALCAFLALNSVMPLMTGEPFSIWPWFGFLFIFFGVFGRKSRRDSRKRRRSERDSSRRDTRDRHDDRTTPDAHRERQRRHRGRQRRRDR